MTNDKQIYNIKDLTNEQAKVLHYLESLAPDKADEMEINSKDLAAKLGLSSRTVSRTLMDLEELGLIEFEFDSAEISINSFL